MLVVSLFLSAILLGIAHYSARSEPDCDWWRRYLVCGLPVVLLPCGVTAILPALMAHYALLALALAAWPYTRARLRSFLPLSLLATGLAYGGGTWLALDQTARLKAQHPLESVVERAPAPRPDYRARGLPEREDGALAALEEHLEANKEVGGLRKAALAQLHNDTTRAFVNSPGFGVARFSLERFLTAADREAPPQQPGPPNPSPLTTWPGAERAREDDGLNHLHWQATTDFVNPAGFGYFKDRRRVAGFQPHGFTQVPGAAPPWRVERVELVGLLKQEVPSVYISDRLPAMQELRDAPTRPLDEFEAEALARLRRGEGLVAASAPGRMRALGALRSARQCAECHGGSRGDLLGAFSYTLRATGTSP